MPSRLISELQPEFAALMGRVIYAWQAEHLDVLITCTTRTADEQAELYAMGRTKPGRIVTYKKPGTSKHELGLAVDFVPLVYGKPVWKFTPNDPCDPWLLAAQVATRVSDRIEWGGSWARFRDMPHLQLRCT